MLKPGDEPIPGYRLVRFLGKGGFGEVWEAQGEYGVRKALKFLDLRGKLGLKEYRGIKRVKDIRSANLMQITDIWMLDESWNVLQADETAQLDSHVPDKTMSIPRFDPDLKRPAVLVVGMMLGDKSLEARLEECIAEHGGGIPCDELLDYMEGAARGIDFLNRHKHETDSGFVTIQHCDIKPANMMLVGNSVVICDFGLAHVLREHQIDETAAAGAPPYISPEMLTTRKPSPTTDQYSLACSYFHLRTGVLPFDSTTSVQAIFIAHTEGRLDFSAIKGPRERKVLQRAASVEPTKRYESCTTFVKELRKAIDEDQTKRNVFEQNKWRIRFRRAAVAAVVLLCLGLVGYGVANPALREKLAGVFAGGDSTDPNGNGSEPPKQNGDDPKPTGNGSTVKASRSPQELIAAADGMLEKNPAGADDGYAQALKALDRQDDKGLRRRAVLGRARANARLAQSDPARWDVVRAELAKFKPAAGRESSAEECIAAVLQALAAEAEEGTPVLNDTIFDGLVRVAATKDWTNDAEAVREQNNKWEEEQFESWKGKMASLVDEKFRDPEVQQWFRDPRFEKVFEGDWANWQTRLLARRHLMDDEPMTETDRAQLEVDLRKAIEQTQNEQAKGQVSALLALLQLRHGTAEVDVALAGFPAGVTDRELEVAFCTAALDQLETRVLTAVIPETVLSRCRELIEDLAKSSAASQSVSLERRLLAVATVNRLWGAEFDQDGVLSDCQSLRDSGATLPAAIQRVIDACWLEAKMVTGGLRPSASIQAIVTALATGGSDESGLAKDYLAYVLALEMRTVERQNAVEVLAKTLTGEGDSSTLDSLKQRSFMQLETRRTFCGTLLTDAAEALREQTQAPLEKPAYAPTNADHALRYLSLAMNDFGVLPEHCYRNLALANFCASAPDLAESRKYSQLITLDPIVRDDGQTLFVRASSWADPGSGNGVGQANAITVYGDYLIWHARYRADTGGWALYEQIVSPALKAVANENYVRNLNDTTTAVEVSGNLPENLRMSLARIYATSGTLVEVDYDTTVKLFGEDREAPIKHRYIYFRAAAALAPQEIDYVIGQYWAVRDWTNREYAQTVAEMETLSATAYALNPEHAAANAMMGESMVAKSRLEPNKGLQRELLRKAIETYFEKALSVPGLKDRPQFLVLRSTAFVEYAFLMNEKLALLQNALADAQAARDSVGDWNRSMVTRASMALGNAAEDIAYYCRFEQEKYYGIALTAFDYSPDAEPYMPGVLAKGRARFRRAAQAHYGFFKPPKSLDVSEEVEQAIREFESVRQKLTQDSAKAEACFFLGSTWDLKSQLAKDEAAKTATATADTVYQEAVAFSDQLSWQIYQTFWARRAVSQGKYSEAIDRANEVLREHSGGRRMVSWRSMYDAMETMFLATPPEAREKLIGEKLDLLPVDDATAAVYRVWWLMLYADQWMGVADRNGSRRFLRSDDPLLIAESSTTTERRLDLFAEYAGKARQLSESLNAVELDAQGVKADDLIAYAIVTESAVRFRQWDKELKNKTKLAAAHAALERAVDRLQDPASVQFPSNRCGVSVGELALNVHVWYGTAALVLMSQSGSQEADKTAIRQPAVKRLKVFKENAGLGPDGMMAISDIIKLLTDN